VHVSPTVILPVRDFTGMSRLSSVLTPSQRSTLSHHLSDRAADSVRDAGLDLVVVSSSSEVATWARSRGAIHWPDPGRGLSAAAASAVDRMGNSPWILLHADLPLVTAQALNTISKAARHSAVLVPSHDGGTNVIASCGVFSFAYGPGSFHRHFASNPHAAVLPSAELSIDIDGPAQFNAFPHLVNASTIVP
jgi:2-phospho-L-lactate guanylyltransferase